MATFLHRLGRFAFRRRHFVALIWVALLTLAGVGAASAPAAGATTFSIPGTEAQKAFDLLEQRVPGMSADVAGFVACDDAADRVPLPGGLVHDTGL